jgi:hypothetical protein
MNVRLTLILVACLTAGCGSEAVQQPSKSEGTKQPPRAEVRIGDVEDQPRHLAFKITVIH